MDTNYAIIPPDTIETLKAWIETGRPMGSFCEAVVSNDLKEAFVRADDDNARALGAIVGWMYWEAPSPCWGSSNCLKDWPIRLAVRKAAAYAKTKNQSSG